MEKLQLEYLYKVYKFSDKDIRDINRKKRLILEIFEDCRKDKVRFIPNVYHINDENVHWAFLHQ